MSNQKTELSPLYVDQYGNLVTVGHDGEHRRMCVSSLEMNKISRYVPQEKDIFGKAYDWLNGRSAEA